MELDRPDRGPVQILGIHVPSYKNVQDAWLPWTDGLALVGANGSGKTNLLEAMSLLLGTPETLTRVRERVDAGQAAGLSVIVTNDHARMPLPPDERFDTFGSQRWAPRYAQLKADSDWWRAANPDPGSPEWAQATVRYTLQYVHLGEGAVLERTFSRSLLPVGMDLRSGRVDGVLDLSLTSQAPASLQWLPCQRTDEEVFAELLAAFEAAEPLVANLVESITALLPFKVEVDPDASWLVHEEGARAATAELDSTVPMVHVSSLGGDAADWEISVGKGQEQHALGRTGEQPVLPLLSSGQRRWVDEAMATMARTIRTIGTRARLHADAVNDLSEDDLMGVLLAHSDVFTQAERDEYWSFESFDQLWSALDALLVAAARNRFSDDPTTHQLVRLLMPYYEALDHDLVIRVFDEPEAHLHTGAQRSVARALNDMRLRGQQVVVASHSAAFVDAPGWTTIHVRNGRVAPVPAQSAPARSALAQDLGMTRGDLLAGIDHILVVEGEHDHVVLEAFWGPELRAAQVAVLRMHGTKQLLATADLDFVQRYLDVGVTVMVDHASMSRVNDSRIRRESLSPEEQKLRQLDAELRRQGRKLDVIALTRPDIVAYLDEGAVRRYHPRFTGWSRALGERPQRGDRYKEWLYARHHADLRNADAIAAIVHQMVIEHTLPGPELTRKIHAFLASRTSSTLKSITAGPDSP